MQPKKITTHTHIMMKLLVSALTLLAVTFSSSSSSVVYAIDCCLCGEDDCNVPPQLGETLVETADFRVLSCNALASELLEVDSGSSCDVAQSLFPKEACCYVADETLPVAELIVPADYDFSSHDSNSEPSNFSRVTHRALNFMFTASSSGSTASTYRAPYNPSYQSAYSAPATTGGSYLNSGQAIAYAGATSYSSGGSSMCTLCRSGQPPKKQTQGCVVDSMTYAYTGTCMGLANDITKLPYTHQMCKVTQAMFDTICGCNANYVPNTQDVPNMGLWCVKGSC
jgi:hypothetical protein